MKGKLVMVSGVSFGNLSKCCPQKLQKKQLGEEGQPPAEFLGKLKDAGIPSDVISKGKEAVESYAKSNNISLPTPPEPPAGGKPDGVPPAGAKSQGAEHANAHSALNAVTSDALKAVMDENQIASTGNLKEDIAAIKATIKGLDEDAAALLKDKLGMAGLAPESVDDKAMIKKAFEGQTQVADMNKHFILGKAHKKASTALS